MSRRVFRAAAAAMCVAGLALVAGAQGPPPPREPGDLGAGPGGPMAGMFELRGLMGAFGGKVVTGKPLLATFTITQTQTLPGNSIHNTTTGTLARDTDGSTYRQVNFLSLGPLASSGKPRNFALIRNLSKMTEYFVNITDGTYLALPLHQGAHGPAPFLKGPDAGNETVTDNPNATYTDPATHTVYKADDRKTSRTIPAGQIGNQFDLVITSERWYSPDLEVVLQETRSDPRFGTTTYQLSGIGQPQPSLFVPDPSFTQVQGKGFFQHGSQRDGKQPRPGE